MLNPSSVRRTAEIRVGNLRATRTHLGHPLRLIHPFAGGRGGPQIAEIPNDGDRSSLECDLSHCTRRFWMRLFDARWKGSAMKICEAKIGGVFYWKGSPPMPDCDAGLDVRSWLSSMQNNFESTIDDDRGVEWVPFEVDVDAISIVGGPQRYWMGMVSSAKSFGLTFAMEVPTKNQLNLKIGRWTQQIAPLRGLDDRRFEFVGAMMSIDPLPIAWELGLREGTRQDDPDLRAERKLVGDAPPWDAMAHLRYFDVLDEDDDRRLTVGQRHALVIDSMLGSLSNSGIRVLFEHDLNFAFAPLLPEAFRAFNCERPAKAVERALDVCGEDAKRDLEAVFNEMDDQLVEELEEDLYGDGYHDISTSMEDFIVSNPGQFYLPE